MDACRCLAGFESSGEVCVECENTQTFKPGISNTQCTDCRLCTGIHGTETWTSTICSTDQNTLCSPCDPCVLGSTFISSICTQYHDAICTDCTICNATQFISSYCSLDHNTECTDIDYVSLCPSANQYRGGHSADSNSVCLPCQTRGIPYNGQQMHEYVADLWSYNDPFSCSIKCLGASRMLNAQNQSLGCTTCETGNVLFKSLPSFDPANPEECPFSCHTGYELREGDCHLKRLAGRAAPRVQVVDISFADGGAGSHDAYVTVTHTNTSRFVVLVGKNKPSCSGRRSIISSCCWGDLSRISTVNQLGYATNVPSDCGKTDVPAQQNSPTEIRFLVSFSALESIGTCKYLPNATQSCEIVISIIDVLTLQQNSQTIQLKQTASTSMALLPPPGAFIPLNAIDVVVIPLFTRDGQKYFMVSSSMIATLATNITMRVRGMERYFFTDSDECSHLSTRSDFDASTTLWKLPSQERKTFTTFWRGVSDTVHAFYTLQASSDISPIVMDIAAVRNVSLIPDACSARPTNVTIEAGHVLAASGMGRDVIMKAQRGDLNLNSSGPLGHLVTFMAFADTSTSSRISVSQILAYHTIGQVIEPSVLRSTNGHIELSANSRRDCLLNTTCDYEYLLSNPNLHLTQTIDCSHQQQARNWIHTHFKTPNDGGHVTAVCERLQAHQHKTSAVLTHVLSSMPHRNAIWRGSKVQDVHSHVFANFNFLE